MTGTQPVDLAPTESVRTPGAFASIVKLLMRQQLTRLRLLLLVLLVGASGVLGWATSGDFQPDQATVEDLARFGLGLIVPLVAVLLGTSTLGDWVSDQTLVYVWLRPVARWKIAVAACTVASLGSIVANLAATFAFVTMGAGLDPTILGATALSTTLATVAYACLFVALGLLARQALLWGVIYVFIWEFFVSRAGDGAAQLSINSYAASILALQTKFDLPLTGRDFTLSLVVLAGVAICATAICVGLLHRADVD